MKMRQKKTTLNLYQLDARCQKNPDVRQDTVGNTSRTISKRSFWATERPRKPLLMYDVEWNWTILLPSQQWSCLGRDKWPNWIPETWTPKLYIMHSWRDHHQLASIENVFSPRYARTPENTPYQRSWHPLSLTHSASSMTCMILNRNRFSLRKRQAHKSETIFWKILQQAAKNSAWYKTGISWCGSIQTGWPL